MRLFPFITFAAIAFAGTLPSSLRAEPDATSGQSGAQTPTAAPLRISDPGGGLPGAENQKTEPKSGGSQERPFITITPNDQIPKVRAILPVDSSNAFFLNHRGQIGVAKFTPGLSQIGWQLYSDVKLNALPSLALGPAYSVLSASPGELTQAFDTDHNAELDFFQALLRDWPGRAEGTTITAGPFADPYGRILFALSPHILPPSTAPKARLMAWSPNTGTATAVTESELAIESFAVRHDGLLAALLVMPDYTDGYFLSLTTLTAPLDPKTAAAPASQSTPPPLPFTIPSLIIPVELTNRDHPIQPTFFEENKIGKLLFACPSSKHLIEVLPNEVAGIWQGSILLREIAKSTPQALASFGPDLLLCGGDEGFFPLSNDSKTYRILRIDLAKDGIVLEFSQPVDRVEAIKRENFSVKAIAFGGGEKQLEIDPMVESDGKVIVLRTSPISPGQVLRVACMNLPSETGDKLLSPVAFYTRHAE